MKNGSNVIIYKTCIQVTFQSIFYVNFKTQEFYPLRTFFLISNELNNKTISTLYIKSTIIYILVNKKKKPDLMLQSVVVPSFINFVRLNRFMMTNRSRKSLINLSHIVVSSTPRHEIERGSNSQLQIGIDCTGSYKSNYHMIMTAPKILLALSLVIHIHVIIITLCFILL